MNRPYVICHMLTSIDGKTTGKFLDDVTCLDAIKRYYKIHAEYKFASFACGRVTMEESFTKGFYPDLSMFSNEEKPLIDNIESPYNIKYAICFDRLGKLGWKSNVIIDEEEGYNNSVIIEVLTEQVDQRYLRYLESKHISYIFAGKDDIDINLALKKLYYYFNISKVLLEGGSTLNASFLKENVIDEVSIVVAPLIAESVDKPLFLQSEIKNVQIGNFNKLNNGVITYNYFIEKDKFLPFNDSLENQIKNYLKLKDKLSNAKCVNKTFRENQIRFSISCTNLNLNKQKYLFKDNQYQYVDLNDNLILQPLLINTLVNVVNLTPLKFKHILDRKYFLAKDKINCEKKFITHSEYYKDKEKYDNEYNVYSCVHAILELLNDVDFSSNSEVFNLLRKYNIIKEDFFMNKVLLIPEILNSKERYLSRYLFYKILVRNHRIKALKLNNCPELVLLNERKLFHKVLFDLCLQLY